MQNPGIFHLVHPGGRPRAVHIRHVFLEYSTWIGRRRRRLPQVVEQKLAKIVEDRLTIDPSRLVTSKDPVRMKQKE